jgi:CHAT domain-containing protein
LLAAGRIRESFGDLQTPSRLHALGVTQLLAGQFDEAAQSLLAASREQPLNAKYLNDVATVQLERARRGLRPDDLPRALAAADRARRLDPSLTEAWFNRALAATALSLSDHAMTAWTEYLQRDSTSPWAAEARSRLEELSRPSPAAAWTAMAGRLSQTIDAATADAAVRAQTTEARSYIEKTLLVEWADAVLAGGSDDAVLERARAMAEAMLRVTGDALYRDAVSAMDQAAAAGGQRLQALAKAHQQYAAAVRVAASVPTSGDPLLKQARISLRDAGSAYAWRAALDLAATQYFQGNYAAASTLLAQLVDTARRANYGYLEGRATWQQGMLAFQQGRLDEAQARYADTLSTFERMGDIEQAGGAHTLLSGVAYVLGDAATEWRHRQAAFESLKVSRSPSYRYQTLVPAAVSLRRESPEAALGVEEEVLRAAAEWGSASALTDAHAQRSATLIALGRLTEAERGLAKAREHLQRIADPAMRSILELPVLSAESDLFRATNPSQAAATAQKAIDIGQGRGDQSRLPPFYLRLAKANIVWGRLNAAEEAVARGIQALDATRGRRADVSGISAFDESWQLLETATRLSIRRGDYERAFALAERARIATGDARDREVVSLKEARGQLAADEAVMVLNQFDDDLAVWLIRRDAVTVITTPVRRLDSERLIARQQEEVRFETAEPSSSAELFDAIVRPLAGQLQGVERMTVVPDATYQDASFAALWDRVRGRFLVEQFTLSAAPSVAALATREPRSSSSQGRALIVAADREAATAQAVAAEYRGPVVVTGASATPVRFATDATTADVVHLTVPTFDNRAFPQLSRVVLSDEPEQPFSGNLLGRDIAARPLPATRIVVLDEMRRQPNYRTAGTFILARAFLAAGVPAVLSTLPGADERATRELMVRFHRELASQASAAEVLTRLQRNVLRSNGRRLGAWSALVMYGSDR